jgi:hypothetical protein
MLPAHSVNGDKATFYFQKIKSIGNGCDFIRLRVCLRLPDNHAISRGKGTDDWRSCRLYELRKRLPSTVTTSLSPSFTASCIQRIKVDCNALESILEIRWAIVLWTGNPSLNNPKPCSQVWLYQSLQYPPSAGNQWRWRK